MRILNSGFCFAVGGILGAIALSTSQAAGPDFPKAVFKGYDERADGTQQILDALEAARPGNKRVLLQFGANWCGPCRKLHGLYRDDRTIAALLSARYVVVFIDRNGGHNKEVDAHYGYPTRLGLPALVVLDASGRLLVTQSSKEWAEGNAHNRNEVLGFLKRWSVGTPAP